MGHPLTKKMLQFQDLHSVFHEVQHPCLAVWDKVYEIICTIRLKISHTIVGRGSCMGSFDYRCHIYVPPLHSAKREVIEVIKMNY